MEVRAGSLLRRSRLGGSGRTAIARDIGWWRAVTRHAAVNVENAPHFLGVHLTRFDTRDGIAGEASIRAGDGRRERHVHADGIEQLQRQLLRQYERTVIANQQPANLVVTRHGAIVACNQDAFRSGATRRGRDCGAE